MRSSSHWGQCYQGNKEGQGAKESEPYRVLYLSPKGSLCYQVPRQAKKLVAVLAASMSMTDKKTEEELERVPYI